MVAPPWNHFCNFIWRSTFECLGFESYRRGTDSRGCGRWTSRIIGKKCWGMEEEGGAQVDILYVIRFLKIDVVYSNITSLYSLYLHSTFPLVCPRWPHQQDFRFQLEPQWSLGCLLSCWRQHLPSLANGKPKKKNRRRSSRLWRGREGTINSSTFFSFPLVFSSRFKSKSIYHVNETQVMQTDLE